MVLIFISWVEWWVELATLKSNPGLGKHVLFAGTNDAHGKRIIKPMMTD
jgi:hypothetical protein